MPRYRESFTLYPRTRKNKKSIWYYRTYDSFSRRTSGRSTGHTSKTRARRFCEKLLQEGRLLQPELPTLRQWTEQESWWRWGECKYLGRRLARSSPDRPAVQRRYADDALTALQTHILPILGNRRLDQISPNDCELLLETWEKQGAAGKTINNRASIMRIMLGEAYRLGLLQENPWMRVQPYDATPKPRDTFTLPEAKLLLDPRTIDTIWLGHQLYYLLNLVAATTGCRQGELLALRQEDIFSDHLAITASYSIRYKERTETTKTKVKAPVPLPRFVWEQIQPFYQWSGYVFSFTRGASPATGNRCTEALYEALERIGIGPAERKDRNLVFHSWRRFYNTYLRSRGVPDAKIRQGTRHKTAAMTEHYTSFHLEDYQEIVAALEDFTEGLES